jgi:hypothetical protein
MTIVFIMVAMIIARGDGPMALMLRAGEALRLERDPSKWAFGGKERIQDTGSGRLGGQFGSLLADDGQTSRRCDRLVAALPCECRELSLVVRDAPAFIHRAAGKGVLSNVDHG